MTPSRWRWAGPAFLLMVTLAIAPPTHAQRAAGGRCVDRAPQCSMLANRGVCFTWSPIMTFVCPFSCRLCIPSAPVFPFLAGAARDPDFPRFRPRPRPEPRPTFSNSDERASDSPFPRPQLRPESSITFPGSDNRGTDASRLRPRPEIERGAAGSQHRPTITRPSFECGGPILSGSGNSGGNSGNKPRRAREANPQNQPNTNVNQQTPDIPQDGGHAASGSPQSFCGATVISNRFILTSATCAINPDHPVHSVRLGDLDLTKDDEANARPVDYAIEQIFVHPDYKPYTGERYNDVALLMTRTRIAFNEFVFPYCLTDQTLEPKTLVIGAGFGLVNETHKAQHLQEAELEVLDTRDCEATYRKAGLEQHLRTAYPALLQKSDVLCAGYPDRGPCKGDEGGPVFKNIADGRRYLVGIISFTGPCKKDNLMPGVFTNLAHHIPFINSVLYGG